MPTDLLDQISEINPLPEDVSAPPLESVRALRERDASLPRERRRTRRGFPKRALLALPVAAAALGLALLGQGGGHFDVAAAVYKATIAGGGVHYMSLEGESGRIRIRYRRWSTMVPFRERDLIERRSQAVELVSGGGFEWAWSTAHRREVLRVRGAAPISKWDPVRVIQQAYRAGRLRVLGRTTLDGRAAYRAEVFSKHGPSGPTVIVDAHTYMPIEMIYYKPSGGPPTLVTHVLAYGELPATSSNLALVRVARHPGARTVSTRRASER